MNMDLDNVFKKACNHAKNLSNISEDQMLKLYGLYKQAIIGSCNIPKPYFWDFTGKAKWENWKAVSNISMEEAKKEYIELVKALDQSWDEHSQEEEYSNKGLGSGMGVSVSTFASDEESLSDSEKSVFDWCKEGELNQIKIFLEKDKSLIQSIDDNQMSLLHWSADRGYSSICEYLIESGCDVNAKDEDGQTALHYAVSCDHEHVVRLLLAKGANPMIKDSNGSIPSDVTEVLDLKKLLTK